MKETKATVLIEAFNKNQQSIYKKTLEVVIITQLNETDPMSTVLRATEAPAEIGNAVLTAKLNGCQFVTISFTEKEKEG